MAGRLGRSKWRRVHAMVVAQLLLRLHDIARRLQQINWRRAHVMVVAFQPIDRTMRSKE